MPKFACRQLADGDPGLVGNLLVERLAGAIIHQVTKEEYASVGAAALGQALLQQLQQEGKQPYYIPVGGSSPLGCWGYLNFVAELQQQLQEMGQSFDIIAAVSSLAGSDCTSL